MNTHTKIKQAPQKIVFQSEASTNNITHPPAACVGQKRFATAAASLLLCGMLGLTASAQEIFIPQTPPRIDTSTDERPEVIELQHGMQRLEALKLMGPPTLESMIGSLDRARATFQDDTELLFEHGKLIAVKIVGKAESTADGRLTFDYEGSTVIFGHDLILPDYDIAPVGDERLRIEDSFYFKDGIHGAAAMDNHFTPSTPQCLLDDCPGCDICGGRGRGGSGCDGCGSSNCSGGCGNGCSRPSWSAFSFAADALFLSRTGGDFSVTLLDGGTTVNADNLSHGLSSGVRGVLGMNLTGEYFCELGYIGLQEWSANGGSTNLIAPAAGVLSSATTYEASMQDFQANFYHLPVDRNWSLLWGVRYSEHEDEFRLDLAGTIAGPPVQVRNPLTLPGQAENQLLGLQIGSQADWNCGRIQLICGIKGGIFRNETRQTGTRYSGAVDLATNPAGFATFISEGEEVSFMGDFEFSARYPILPWSSVRVGYKGLVFSDMVQVRDQGGSAAVPTTLSYHGAFAGLESRF